MDFINNINIDLNTSNTYYSFLTHNKVSIKYEKKFTGKIFFYFPHNDNYYWIPQFGRIFDDFIFSFIGKQFFLYFEGNNTNYKIEFSNSENLKILDYEFYHLFNKLGIYQVHVSDSLIHLREKIKNTYHLEYYHCSKKPLLIFGLYNNLDKKIIQKHKGKIYLIWGGSDLLINKNEKIIPIINKKKIINFSLSSKIKDKCESLGFKNNDIFLTFCFGLKPYLYPLTSKRHAIYIYDGLSKNEMKNKIYNQKMIDNILKKINYPVFRSSEMEFTDEIWKIYEKCFIGLRLTIHDGNANQIQECGLLGIPCVSNQEMNHCLDWNSEEEIIYKIKYIYENNISIKFNYPKNKVLIISSDKPGNGGGSTSSYKLHKFLTRKGFSVNALYLVHDEKERIEDNICFLNFFKNYHLKNYLKKLDYDIVILRTGLNYKSVQYLKEKFNKIYFFVPGIFINEMDKKDTKFLHKGNIRQIQTFPSFTNSLLTKKIINQYGFIDNEIGVIEHNLLNLYDKMVLKKEIEWDCVFVCSDLDRKIKNADLALELLEFFGKRNWKTLVISNKEYQNEKYKFINFKNNIEIEKMNEIYEKTRVVINTSYFDSMSNVLLEAINYNCHILCSSNNGIVNYIKNKDKFIVPNLDLENWKFHLRKVMKEYEKNKIYREELFNDLLTKKWEVEIKCLNLLK